MAKHKSSSQIFGDAAVAGFHFGTDQKPKPASPSETPDKKLNQTENIHPSQTESLQKNISSASEFTTLISTGFTQENMDFLKIRSTQRGYSIKEYMNLLIDHQREKNKIPDTNPLLYQFKGKKTRTSFQVTDQNNIWLHAASRQAGTKLINFLNRIVADEKDRELKNN